FLRAAERGEVVRNPLYLLVSRGGRLVAVAYAYDLTLDLLSVAPPAWRKYLAPFVRLARWAFSVPLRGCGSPVSNGCGGVWTHRAAPPAGRAPLVKVLHARVSAGVRPHQLVLFKDLPPDEEGDWGAPLGRLGYFRMAMLPGMALPVRWPNAA